ncbi:MAG: hypothetical protein EOP83_06110 [Verrucomicrobiaceae bacterium]|nr:MAG: hypothetical protein EOP83_06110 [Verrucomicrobiaceae bacterium]
MASLYNLSTYLPYLNSLNQPNLTSAVGIAATQTPATAGATTPATNATTTTPTATSTASQTDDRVRIAHLDGYSPSGGKYPGIQAPLEQTKGFMFPYTPTIQISQDVDYGVMSMTHSNTDYHYFNRSPNATISISGKFTVQNQYEGQYAIGCIQFLRTVSKMNFGQADANAGLPPPILALSGHGTYMFNKVRVFVKTHSYTYDESMDLVNVKVGSGNVRLPALFTLSVSLTTQPTPNMMRTQFNLDQYRSGALLANGGWL